MAPTPGTFVIIPTRQVKASAAFFRAAGIAGVRPGVLPLILSLILILAILLAN